MDIYRKLPLFPLYVVLYPEMPLPLKIFEPRYRRMINQCIQDSSPFGVVLIKRGEEAGGGAVPYDVGTTARIGKLESSPEGEMHIFVTGERRFRIEDIDESNDYLTARVTKLSDRSYIPSEIQATFEKATDCFKEYLRFLLSLSHRSMGAVQLPSEPEYLSYAIAGALQSPLLDKQRLLETVVTSERLEMEIELMEQQLHSPNIPLSQVDKTPEGLLRIITPVNTRDLSKYSSLN